MEKSQKVTLLVNIVLVGFVVAVFFHYILGFYMHSGAPFNTFLFDPNWVLGDMKVLTEASLHLQPFAKPNYLVVYFPLTYFFLFPFALLKNYLFEFLIFLSIFLIFFIRENVKNFADKSFTKGQNFQNIFVLTFITYPFLYLLERGNLDMLLIILFTIAIYAFRNKHYYKSAILFAILNSFKPFFFPFLALFIFEKRWRELTINLLLTFYLVIFGFFLLHGNTYAQFAGFKTNLYLYKQAFFDKPSVTCSSLFQALTFINYTMHSKLSLTLINLYNYILLFASGITFYFSFREKIFWKKIAILTLYMLIFPHTVFDYKLIFLFIPLWLFVNAEEKNKLDWVYIILFGLLLIPKKQVLFIPCADFSVLANPLIMLIFMGLIIFEQFRIKRNNG